MKASPPRDNEDRVLLGRITGAHGLKGEVKIAAFTAAPEDIAAYGALTGADGARGSIASFASRRAARSSRAFAASPIATKRRAMRGVDLYAPRSALPPRGRGTNIIIPI